MRKLRALWMRLGGMLSGRREEDDFAAELEAHVALHTEEGIRAGVTAAIQPGGSVKDTDVVAAADAAGIAMVVTGQRHFKH